MMGLCKSCFSRPLGSSPEPDTHSLVPGDHEKLLLAPELVTGEPSRQEAAGKRWEEGLEKSETGDSGTCVDEILGGPGQARPGEEDAVKAEDDVFEVEDLVQLTVSSIASLGMLEDVPEHAEEEGSELGEEQATVTTTLSLPPEPPASLMASPAEEAPGAREPGPLRPPHAPPAQRPRTASSGQEPVGRRQFVIHKVSSKSLLMAG
jgi:hypothetical protein